LNKVADPMPEPKVPSEEVKELLKRTKDGVGMNDE